MKTRHARAIRAGIERAQLAQKLIDGINLNPTTLGAMALGVALLRLTTVQTSALEHRAYMRTLTAVHEPHRNRRES